MAVQNRRTTGTVRRRNHPRRRGAGRVFVFFLVVLLAVAAGMYLTVYGPTREKLPLDEYYTFLHDDEAALVINDTYIEPGEEDIGGCALVRNGHLYVERGCFKDNIDDGYVFDDVERVMRYATENTLVEVPYDGNLYTVGGASEDAGAPVVISDYEKVYLLTDFAAKYSDFSCTLFKKPYRAVLTGAGFERQVASVKWSAAVRRLGGPKSKIVKTLRHGAKVSVLKNYGTWSNVVTEDGVVGYVKNRQIGRAKAVTTKAVLPERQYRHKTLDDEIMLGWHQVTSKVANAGVDKVLVQDKALDVISPTWFYLNDSEGGVADFSAGEYVQHCHNRGVQVWGLISDFENTQVDEVSVLNRASRRDRLVNNLISAALACGMDGINVDFEKVPTAAADGYIQFIRELSLQCEANDLFLSVDNYVLASYNSYYNRKVQSDYADYLIVMAYDEHYRGGEEAGSNASETFVKEGIEATLQEVPRERLVLGMPFYCREWIETENSLLSRDLRMRDVPGYLTDHSLKPAWDESLGQNYVEYKEDGAKHMLWIEDTQSLERKLSLMKQFELAGGAFWKLGSETEDVWPVIMKYR